MKRFPAMLVGVVLLWTAYGQQPWDFSRESARQGPEWLRSGVIYEIYPRAFSPEGNFAGVTARLDDLRSLGVTILWIMPVNPVGQAKKKGTVGSPYAVRDYYGINRSYGTQAEFKELVLQAHRRGFKVILDVVLNHTAWDNPLIKNPSFYKHDSTGAIIPPVPDWRDVAGLNYSSPELRQYMAAMLEWWLRTYDLDGFRCDVAGMVPVDFWEQARQGLEKIKPGIMMLAEASEPNLLVKAFDADYAWPFHATLTDVLENGKPAPALRAVWLEQRARFPRGSLHMRFSDNHDEKRAIGRFGERGALAASALVFGMDGVPMLYNGMEVGDTTESGAPALFERLPIFWQFVERRPEFPAFYRAVISMRRDHPALQQGETMWLDNSDPSRIVALRRRSADEEFLVAVNLSNRPFAGRVDLEQTAGFVELPLPPSQPSAAALPALDLGAWGYRFYRRAIAK
jgi:cyclomaltodextrinase